MLLRSSQPQDSSNPWPSQGRSCDVARQRASGSTTGGRGATRWLAALWVCHWCLKRSQYDTKKLTGRREVLARPVSNDGLHFLSKINNCVHIVVLNDYVGTPA